MTKQCLSGKYLWHCGQYTGFIRDRSGKLILENEENQGIFVSQTYDSGRKETEWNRLVLDISRNAVLQVYVYLFDDEKEGEKIDHMISIGDRAAYLKACAQYTSHYREMLLYGQKQGRGRFARLMLEIIGEQKAGGTASGNTVSGNTALRNTASGNTVPGNTVPGNTDVGRAVMTGYAMSFPRESFTRYLPSIYRDNIQLDRFLAVQQSLYLELEQRIDGLAEELDYELCGKMQAVKLAEWLGWGELAGMAEDDVLRQLLKTGISLSSRKGTRYYYEKLTEILTGQEAVLLEEPEKRECTLLVKGYPGPEKVKYLDWIRRNTPIGIKMDIVILHRTDRLDGQYFLDYTSCLAQQESEIMEKGTDIDHLRLL